MKLLRVVASNFKNCCDNFNGKVSLRNMHDAQELDPALLKSKRSYNNALQSAVNYEDLMRLKKDLMHA